MSYPDRDRLATLLSLVLKFLSILQYDFHLEANLTVVGNQMCKTKIIKKKKKKKGKTEYKILVGEYYTKFIQTSPGVLSTQSFYDNKSDL